MRVRLLTGAIRHGFTYDAGQEIDLPSDEAERYIAENFATAVEEPASEPVIETAAISYQPKRVKHGRNATTR